MIYLPLLVVMFVAGGVTENCLSWAVRKRILCGGKLATRPSHFADDCLAIDKRKGFAYWLAKKVPHVLWISPEGEIWQYTVTDEWRKVLNGKPLFAAWLALWFYDGHVVHGDDELERIIRNRG